MGGGQSNYERCVHELTAPDRGINVVAVMVCDGVFDESYLYPEGDRKGVFAEALVRLDGVTVDYRSNIVEEMKRLETNYAYLQQHYHFADTVLQESDNVVLRHVLEGGCSMSILTFLRAKGVTAATIIPLLGAIRLPDAVVRIRAVFGFDLGPAPFNRRLEVLCVQTGCGDLNAQPQTYDRDLCELAAADDRQHHLSAILRRNGECPATQRALLLRALGAAIPRSSIYAMRLVQNYAVTPDEVTQVVAELERVHTALGPPLANFKAMLALSSGVAELRCPSSPTRGFEEAPMPSAGSEYRRPTTGEKED